jgi:hypothetical protein
MSCRQKAQIPVSFNVKGSRSTERESPAWHICGFSFAQSCSSAVGDKMKDFSHTFNLKTQKIAGKLGLARL